jgi:hypothetical protein
VPPAYYAIKAKPTWHSADGRVESSLERLLYEVKPFDLITFAGVSLLLFGAALLASPLDTRQVLHR